jgi:hypothetical protein
VFKLLPWLALCLLFLLKSNRCGQAWWILGALAASLVLQAAGEPILAGMKNMGSQAAEMLLQVARVLMYCLAGWWLVSRSVTFKHAFLSFLGSAVAVAIFWAVAVVTGPGMEEHGAICFLSLICAGLLVVGVHLAGWFCRRRYGAGRFLLRLGVAIPMTVGMAVGPFLFLEAMMSGNARWLDALEMLLMLAVFLFVVVLPFAGLSVLNGFYRERLKDLLALRPNQTDAKVVEAPPILAQMPKDSLEPRKVS